jgi:transcriptional regulator with XRE-family HTH domain
VADAVETIAANLCRIRAEKGMTQQEVAAGAAMWDPREIRELEAGRRDPGARVQARLAKSLGVHPTELWRDYEPDD